MLKFFTLLLLSSTAFASNLILEKNVTSGFTQPENSFVKECRIFLDGTVEAITVSGDGTAIGFARNIDAINIRVIKGLNQLALKGTMITTPATCDAGGMIFRGFHDGKEVEIDIAPDCGAKRTNKSTAASVLRSMAREICGF